MVLDATGNIEPTGRYLCNYAYDRGRPRSTSLNPGDVPLETWTQAGSWAAPPSRIDLTTEYFSPLSNVGATISTLLARDDLGIEPRPDGYNVIQNDGTESFPGSLGSVYADGSDLLIGPPQEPATASDCLSNDDCEPPLSCSLNRCVQVCTQDSDCAGAMWCLHQTMFPTHPGARTPCEPGVNEPCACTWPDGSMWKFVVAHEAGHQVADLGIGTQMGGLYTFECPANTVCEGRISERPQDQMRLVDPPFVDSTAPLCGCQHVEASNAVHCLQSVERSGKAQSEGFAQFFSSRVWNQQDSLECTFVYYKEFLDEVACDPSEDREVCQPFPEGDPNAALYRRLPPLEVSCNTPYRWRNTNCGAADPMVDDLENVADFGTELDWMGFLYNLNSVGPAETRSPMTDIWKIYRHACVPPAPPGTDPPEDPPPCSSVDIGFAWGATALRTNNLACMDSAFCAMANPDFPLCLDDAEDSVDECTDGTCLCKSYVQGFFDGVNLTYPSDSREDIDHRDTALNFGMQFGVDRNLTP